MPALNFNRKNIVRTDFDWNNFLKKIVRQRQKDRQTNRPKTTGRQTEKEGERERESYREN